MSAQGQNSTLVSSTVAEPYIGAPADGSSEQNALWVNAKPMLLNGSTLDRERGNTEGTLLASAARTGYSLTAIQTNHNARGVILTLACTAKAGSTLIRPYLVAVDPATTYYSTIGAFSTGKDVSPGPNLMMLTCYPGAVGTETGFSLQFHETIQQPLPRTWFAYVEHGDSDSITYSLSYQLIL